MGVRESLREAELQTNSSFAFYIRLIRKGFFSLIKNTIKVKQRRKLNAMRALLLQRRWFFALRRAALFSKNMRQVRTQSAIFHFLSVERRGFNSLANHMVFKKQARMKVLLANEIYLKGLAVKVLQSLRNHREDCLMQTSSSQRLLKEGFSYCCDISQFENGAHHLSSITQGTKPFNASIPSGLATTTIPHDEMPLLRETTPSQ